jgi:alcohol dehydrogenase class IV
MTREAQQQRMANIMSALQIGQGVMSDSDRNQLQRELADLDAALKREGLDVTRQQTAVGQQESQADQALRKYLADQSTGFNYAQLGQQGTQFGQQLGATLGMHDADLNQALIIALLGGQGGGAA